MKFFIEQIALAPPHPEAAIKLLKELGLDEWARDLVEATGLVRGVAGSNSARLAFNYQATRAPQLVGMNPEAVAKPIELEVLRYDYGPNWIEAVSPMDRAPCVVSHLGMHCSEEELDQWRLKFKELGVSIAQEVLTTKHTNPVIAGKRWYRYVIFDTRAILGVDLKFIVRRDSAPLLEDVVNG